MADSSDTVGIFISMLTVLFIGLKLTHQIDWSWWWVLSPIWLPFVGIFGVVIVALLIGALIFGLIWFFNQMKRGFERL